MYYIMLFHYACVRYVVEWMDVSDLCEKVPHSDYEFKLSRLFCQKAKALWKFLWLLIEPYAKFLWMEVADSASWNFNLLCLVKVLLTPCLQIFRCHLWLIFVIFFIYLKTKTIEHWHIIIKKYLNLNGLSFAINNSALMSLDYNIANLTYCKKGLCCFVNL
jgi:hypothetical protein